MARRVSRPTRRGPARRRCTSRAKAGFIVDRENNSSQLQLTHGTQHTTHAAQPDEYQGDRVRKHQPESRPADRVSAAAVERRARDDDRRAAARHRASVAKRGDPGHNSRFMIQNKYSFPVACCVLALVALALGVSNRKDGKLASFAIGFIVVFAYYVLLYMARAAALGGKLNADFAPWIPHVRVRRRRASCC